jgi:DNA-binding transcriptional regulator PaaX
MGILEEESQKKLKRVKITKIVLGTIAVAGALSVALVAPNVLQVMKMFNTGKGRKMKAEYGVNRALSRLINDGSIKKVEIKNKFYFELTSKGRKKLGELFRYHLLLKKPKRWDGRWRIVSFDVYEKRRNVRDKLRYILKRVGFLQLHQSMWVYPYDCEDLVALLKSDLHVGRNVLYIIADKIESDTRLKKYFEVK